MAYYDHTCEECSHWDDINGCWQNMEPTGSFDIACILYDGDDKDDSDDNE
jgi:hypothetical protein